MAIADNSGKLRFRSICIDAYNANVNMHNSNAVRRNKLGIGANAVVDVLNVTQILVQQQDLTVLQFLIMKY